MSPASPAPAPRAFALAALLLASGVGGCIGAFAGEDPVLVDPGIERVILPGTRNLSALVEGGSGGGPGVPDFKRGIPDPPGWHVGDYWYYESNRSNYMRAWIPRAYVRNGTPYFVLATETGLLGFKPMYYVISEVNGQTYETVRNRLPEGLSVFRPPHPGLRFLHEGSFAYREFGTQKAGEAAVRYSVEYKVNVTIPAKGAVSTPAGFFKNATYFKIFTTKCPLKGDGKCDAKKAEFLLSQRWYDPAVGNDVALITNQQERFQLAAWRLNGTVGGITDTPCGYPGCEFYDDRGVD